MANDEKKTLDAVETTTVTTPEAEPKKDKKKKDKKVYKLRSAEKFLTVGSLGVQFFDGKYETTDADEATALLTIDSVDLVEE